MAIFESLSLVGVLVFVVAAVVADPIPTTVANPVLSVTTSVQNAHTNSLGVPIMANTLPASKASVTLLASQVDPFQQASIMSSQMSNAMSNAVNSHIQQVAANAIAHLAASQQSMMAVTPVVMAPNNFNHFTSMPAVSVPGRTVVETRYEIIGDKKNCAARKSTSKPVSSSRSSGSRSGIVITHDDGTPIGKLY
ncbi:uncharacterized protein LOC116339688 [Contarinia nasturtii]|uniref:uncharacterized protein LOC116339688 n=1 Tax=Contarinia nasturtii TaxID=265458 RepID=UPI0012D3827C|nr:uncharacterized protein LOC116339688 [Contarinia nasturtii]